MSVHFLRGVPASPIILRLLGQAREALLQVLRDCVGPTPLDAFAETQACLPLRLGGCGIKDPTQVRVPARIAGILTYLHHAAKLGFPPQCNTAQPPPDLLPLLQQARLALGDNFDPLPEWLGGTNGNVVLRNIEPKHRSQRWWSDAWYKAIRINLAERAFLRDRKRLKLQSMAHTTAWMQWVPLPDGRATYEPSEYRLLLRFWLGLHVIPGDAGQPCPHCGQALDSFGDHLVSCTKNNLTQRHHSVCRALQEVLAKFGVACRREVPLASRLQRPGDLAIDNLGERPILVDLTCHHPLAPGLDRAAPDRVV